DSDEGKVQVFFHTTVNQPACSESVKLSCRNGDAVTICRIIKTHARFFWLEVLKRENIRNVPIGEYRTAADEETCSDSYSLRHLHPAHSPFYLNHARSPWVYVLERYAFQNNCFQTALRRRV